MNVTCPDCHLEYDDTYRWTFCPHETFEMHCTVSVGGQLGCAHTVEEQMAALSGEGVLPNPDCELLKFQQEFIKDQLS